MNIPLYSKPASDEEKSLYMCVGEAICHIQHMEDALCHYATLKSNPNTSKSKADEELKTARSHSLGRSLSKANQGDLLPKQLHNELKKLLEERNWLVHHSIAHRDNEVLNQDDINQLQIRINEISKEAMRLQRALENDLIEYCETRGKDMSAVRKACEDYHSK